VTFKKPPQLGYRFLFDSAAQDEYRESPSRSGLNPESHQFAPFSRYRSRDWEQCNRVPNWISLKNKDRK
jgi:hypothetical protein